MGKIMDFVSSLFNPKEPTKEQLEQQEKEAASQIRAGGSRLMVLFQGIKMKLSESKLPEEKKEVVSQLLEQFMTSISEAKTSNNKYVEQLDKSLEGIAALMEDAVLTGDTDTVKATNNAIDKGLEYRKLFVDNPEMEVSAANVIVRAFERYLIICENLATVYRTNLMYQEKLQEEETARTEYEAANKDLEEFAADHPEAVIQSENIKSELEDSEQEKFSSLIQEYKIFLKKEDIAYQKWLNAEKMRNDLLEQMLDINSNNNMIKNSIEYSLANLNTRELTELLTNLTEEYITYRREQEENAIQLEELRRKLMVAIHQPYQSEIIRFREMIHERETRLNEKKRQKKLHEEAMLRLEEEQKEKDILEELSEEEPTKIRVEEVLV